MALTLLSTVDFTMASHQSILTPVDYEYHHGTGKHVLIKPDEDPNRPRYSAKCILCSLIDVLIFVGCIVFLYFAITYALSCLEDSDN